MRLAFNWIDQAPKVLLVHNDEATLDRWRDALLDCSVRTAGDLAELEASVESRIPDVVVGLWNKDLIEQLRVRWPRIRFIHFGERLSNAVLDAIAQGHEVFHVGHIDELEDKVFAVAKPRRMMARQAAQDLKVAWRGAPHRFDVVDVSSNGLSLMTQPKDDLSRMQPGTVLEHLEITRNNKTALSHVSAVVRRIEVRENAYLIGAELLQPFNPRQVPPRVITDRALCAGLVQNAVKSGALFLIDPDNGHLLQPANGSLDPDGVELTLELFGHGFKMFDIVEAAFELSGGAYRFRATVCQDHPLKLRMPASLEETRRRATPRWRPTSRLSVTLFSPLLETYLERPLYDLSATGLSFEVGATDVLPQGMHFDRIELKLERETLVVKGRVRNLARGPSADRCGVQLEAVDEEERTHLSDFIVHARCPGLENGRTTPFDELCEFFRKAGFLYPEKEVILAPLMPTIREVHGAITARPNSIARSVQIRHEGTLAGYCAGLQAYRTTWMFHHLAALPGFAAGGLLSIGVVEHLMQSVEYDYFRMWFFEDASFPRRLFGGFARKVADADQSFLRFYSHFHVPVDRRFATGQEGIETGEATDDELFEVERHFIKHELPLAVRAEDLTASGLRMNAVRTAYQQEGVERRRQAISARRDGRLLGFVLAEVSSPGLNLSEAMSSFRIFVTPAGQDSKADVRRALLDPALELYGSEGRIVGRCLFDPGEVPEYEALGIQVDKGRSICWTAHRAQLPAFNVHMRTIFSRLAARQKRAAGEKPTPGDAS